MLDKRVWKNRSYVDRSTIILASDSDTLLYILVSYFISELRFVWIGNNKTIIANLIGSDLIYEELLLQQISRRDFGGEAGVLLLE